MRLHVLTSRRNNRRSYRSAYRHRAALTALLLTAALLAAAFGGAVKGAATITFAPRGVYSSGLTPISVTSADFDGDGKPDLASANFGDDTVSVDLNRAVLGAANDDFAGHLDFAVGNQPSSITTADLNGDGKPDLVVSNSNSGSVSVLLNTTPPGSALSLAAKQDFAAGASPISVTSADFNGDGKPDLVVSNSESGGSVSVLLNTTVPGSALSFAAKQDFGANSTPRSVTVADFNGDGRPDLAVANNFVGTVSVLLNTTATGAATPDFAARQSFDAGFRPSSITSADFNGDGKPDLGVAHDFNGISVLLNTTAAGAATPGFTARRDFGFGDRPSQIAAGDFDRDGKPDLAVVDTQVVDTLQEKVSVLVNTTAPGASTPDFAAGQDFIHSGFPPTCLNVTDFNRDGRPDLAMGGSIVSVHHNAYGISVMLNTTVIPATVGGGVFEFKQPLYTVAERGGQAAVTVLRNGDSSLLESVDYATDDGSTPAVTAPCSANAGTALERCDYTRAVGTLLFAAGDREKTFFVPVNDDAYTEGTETTHLRLSNPTGRAVLGTRSEAALEITDDVPESAGNPIDDDETFVRQHYHDFLGREPDADGLKFWTDGIRACGADADCRAAKRVNTSAAFFLSIEFQQTGYLVERAYKVAFGNLPGAPVPVTYAQLMTDTQRIGQGIVVNQGDWRGRLETNTPAFLLDFVQRPAFAARYPPSMSGMDFARAIDANAGGVLSERELETLASSVDTGSSTTSGGGAFAVRTLAENPEFSRREFNRGFVLMQYFGYLRRNPNDAPEENRDYTGYNYWLAKLDQFNGNPVAAEMVKAFINSDEYRQRFAQ